MDDFLDYIPHRPPFLFVDRVLEASDEHIKTERRVKEDESWVEGHYPGRPIMPGVLICESIFQAGAVLMGRRGPIQNGKVPVVTRINQAKFKHAVKPGDLLEIEVTLKEMMGQAAYLSGKAKVGGKTAVTVEFSAMLVEDTA